MRPPPLQVFADGVLVADEVRAATRFFDRLRGLIWKRRLGRGEGLLLQPGGSVHTFGMRFAIDVLFLDQHYAVLDVCDNVAPNRMCLAPRGTRATLELRRGRANRGGDSPAAEAAPLRR